MTYLEVYDIVQTYRNRYNQVFDKHGYDLDITFIESNDDFNSLYMKSISCEGEITEDELACLTSFEEEVETVYKNIIKYSKERYAPFMNHLEDIECVWELFGSPFGPLLEELINWFNRNKIKLTSAILNQAIVNYDTYYDSDENIDLWENIKDKYMAGYNGNPANVEKGILYFTSLTMWQTKYLISNGALLKYTKLGHQINKKYRNRITELDLSILSIDTLLQRIGCEAFAVMIDYDLFNKKQWPYGKYRLMDLLLSKLKKFDLYSTALDKSLLLGITEYKSIPIKQISALAALECILHLEKYNKTCNKI